MGATLAEAMYQADGLGDWAGVGASVFMAYILSDLGTGEQAQGWKCWGGRKGKLRFSEYCATLEAALALEDPFTDDRHCAWMCCRLCPPRLHSCLQLFNVFFNSWFALRPTTACQPLPGLRARAGIYHWGVDNYGDGNTPVFGRQIAAFQGHHQKPWTIVQREFCNNLYQVGQVLHA
eukprot:1159425-Pelagomonas_calceolata.AAC.2